MSSLSMEWCEAYEGNRTLGVCIVRGLLDDAEVEAAHRLSSQPGAVFADDRSDGLEFVHRVWRVEVPLRRGARGIYEKILGAAEECDDLWWGAVHETRMRGLVYPEIEYIEYDAESCEEGAKKPSIEPHVDNASVVTMVAMLSDSTCAFTGGTNYFEPGMDSDIESDSSSSSSDDSDSDSDSDASSSSDEDKVMEEAERAVIRRRPLPPAPAGAKAPDVVRQTLGGLAPGGGSTACACASSQRWPTRPGGASGAARRRAAAACGAETPSSSAARRWSTGSAT